MKMYRFMTVVLLTSSLAAAQTVIDIPSEGGALAQAIDAARQRAEKTLVTLRLASGMHPLTAPVVLTPADSSLTIEGAPGATPIISGGRRIAGWRRAQLNGVDAWAVDLPAVRNGTWFFRELWVDGKRATRARHPNRGTFAVVGTPDVAKSWQDGHTRFTFKDGDVPAGPFAPGAEARIALRMLLARPSCK